MSTLLNDTSRDQDRVAAEKYVAEQEPLPAVVTDRTVRHMLVDAFYAGAIHGTKIAQRMATGVIEKILNEVTKNAER